MKGLSVVVADSAAGFGFIIWANRHDEIGVLPTGTRAECHPSYGSKPAGDNPDQLCQHQGQPLTGIVNQ